MGGGRGRTGADAGGRERTRAGRGTRGGAARVAGTLLLIVACRGESPVRAQDTTIAALVDSLRPAVESAVGLPFREAPRSALRSRDEVRRYLVAKLDEEIPPARARRIEAAYRLFGMLPDTIAIRPLLLELLTEQVVGFYDPDSAMLFGVEGGDPMQMRLVLAHEMVHALQGQYLSLDSLLAPMSGNDRLSAVQAVLEGQATLASLELLSPDPSVLADPGFWELYQGQVQASQSAMPRFAAAPLIVRAGLIFPYVQGAQFVNWWHRNRPRDSMPWGANLPQSTEQVLHPERYAQRDVPVQLRFVDSATNVVFEDGLGELEMLVLTAVAAGATEVPDRTPLGWGGDRYRVVETDDGPALVWYVVFDTPSAAERFAATTGQWLAARRREHYRSDVARVEVGGQRGIRWVFAPTEWERWGDFGGGVVTTPE